MHIKQLEKTTGIEPSIYRINETRCKGDKSEKSVDIGLENGMMNITQNDATEEKKRELLVLGIID
ncbi:hypothetical protein LGL08_08280 [Clostridium estertheticum]|uniref:hypothetical protein n=1 Tax=Clostridium estertheticum TaxID=238834 RepID=UPI001CF11D47|nr:hypothetical protein [Clostridium estertheticum]MCB2349554.1 hypothetical protein [Clostridium estertheticum]WAG46525.1 hypothetical protein LL127_02955 [Clostridium estertheticum]